MSFPNIPNGFESKYVNNSSFSTTIVVLRSILLFLIVFIIILTNIVNIFVIVKLRELQIVGKILFVNLSIAGLLNGAFVCIPGLLSSLTNVWFWGKSYCQFSSIVNGSCSSVTIWTLAAISFDRYLAIIHPVTYRTSSKFWLILVIIASFWLAGIITFATPLLINYEYYEYQASVFICSMFWKSRIFCIVTGLYIPILSACIIFWSTYKITKCLKSIVKTKLTRRFSSGTYRTTKTIRIIFINAVIYLAVWAPYTISVYLVSFGAIMKIPEHMNFVIIWLANCCSFMNVIIYCGKSEEYRRRLRHCFNCFQNCSGTKVKQELKESRVTSFSN